MMLPDRLPPYFKRLLAEQMEAQQADVLAYLARLSANCDTMARRWPDLQETAQQRRRVIDHVAGEIRAGMHVGAAQKEADLKALAEGGTPSC